MERVRACRTHAGTCEFQHASLHGATSNRRASSARSFVQTTPAAAGVPQAGRHAGHCCSCSPPRKRPCSAMLSSSNQAVAVTEAAAAQQQLTHQQHNLQGGGAVDTYSLLRSLHALCDDSGQLAAPAELQAWADTAQPHLPSMALAEVAYLASCLRHYQYALHHYQQQQQQLAASSQCMVPSGEFVSTPEFLQEACTCTCIKASAVLEDLQDQQQHHSSGGLHPVQLQHQHGLLESLQQLLEVLQWAAGEVVRQRQLLQQQLQALQPQQQQQQLVDLQAYRRELQQHVEAQQQAQQLLQHPLLLLALPQASCWQLQQLLLCSGQLGQTPGFDWMGHWLAAARHAMSDLVLPYHQDQWPFHHVQQQQEPQHQQQCWPQDVQESSAAAATAYLHLVGLLSGLAAAQLKPPEAWTAAWQQATMAVLRARPCFTALDDSTTISANGSSSTFMTMLRQLLQSVSRLNLRLSAEFWTAHEGLLQSHVLCLTPAGLLRVLQLHQQLNFRPSKACIKYMTAVLEQHLQQQQPTPGSNAVVLQLLMCACALSVWHVRLHLPAVSQLLLLLDVHKQQLPLTVVLQVLATLGPRLGRAYTHSDTTEPHDLHGSFAPEDPFSSSSSMSSSSTDGEDAAAVATPARDDVRGPQSDLSAAAAIESLLVYAADQLAPRYLQSHKAAADQVQVAHTAAGSADDSSSSSSSRPPLPHSHADSEPLLKLLHVSGTLARHCRFNQRSSSGSGGMMAANTLGTATASITTFAAAAAEVRSQGHQGTFVDQLVHDKLHPLCAAVAPECSPQQLVALMAAWGQLGFSRAWRFGGFRRGYKRLGDAGQLRTLSNAELAAAVEAVAPLPAIQTVVQALASEVLRRQLPAMHQHEDAAAEAGSGGVDAGTASDRTGAPTEPFSPSQLLAVVCAVPSLGAVWPTSVTLQLLQQIQGSVEAGLNPSQQWRLWKALQQLQQQWKPSVVAAAAAAAAASDGNGPRAAAQGDSDRAEAASADLHKTVSFPAAAAAAALKAGNLAGAAAPNSQGSGNASSVARSDDTMVASPTSSTQQQQQLMVLLDELQDRVAAALARVQPDPDALPVDAAPPRVPRPLHAGAADAAAAAAGGDHAAYSTQRALEAEGRHTQQQVLAAFAKAQKSLLNPHCTGAALVQALEGLVLLLAVPRYAKAAKKDDKVRRAMLRALEAAAWPDLLGHTLDLQQLLLITGAARGLGSTPDTPYMQMLSQETSRLLSEGPLRLLASALGRLAALRLPQMYRPDVVLLKFWVGRLAQAAKQTPADALAVVVPLVQLGFRPAAGAAALVLQPLLAAAHDSSRTVKASSSSSSSGDCCASEVPSAELSMVNVLGLTRVLADMGLSLDSSTAKQLLMTQVGFMQHCSDARLLQLARDVMRLELLTTASPPNANDRAAAGVDDAGVSSSSGGSGDVRDGSAPRSWLLPAAGLWVSTWLQQLLRRNMAKLDVAKVVELQLLLCELDMVPWHLSQPHSAPIHASLQQLSVKLAATAHEWQQPLAAAVQASYHSTHELRRLVAAQARREAHLKGSSGSSNSSISASTGAAAPSASLSSVRAAVAAAMQTAGTSTSTGTTNSSSSNASSGSLADGSRRFVSRKVAAAAAAASGSSLSGVTAACGFTYPSNLLQHQLHQLSHQKRVLLWAAIKHSVVQPASAAWVESCCFNVLVGRHQVTPTVATGLLLAVTAVRREEQATLVSGVDGDTVDRAMRDKALADLTSELAGRVVSSLAVLRGALFVQTLASLASAGVVAAATQRCTPEAAAAATGAAQPLFVLAPRQREVVLSAVSRVLPSLQPPQLPLLVNSMLRLQLQPDAAWLSSALEALAVKAAAAAAAGQPAQQLLLLAAAKQLLVCGGVHLLPQAPPAAVTATGAAAGAVLEAEVLPTAAGGRSPVAAAVLPVAFAFRALAAGAAQVLGSMFKRSQQQQQQLGNHHSGQAGGSKTAGNGALGALAATAAVAAAMTDTTRVGDTSVALLLSSLATQLQLVQSASPGAVTHTRTALAPTGAADRQLQPAEAVAVGQQGRQDPQHQLLAAAVLLHAGSGTGAALPGGAAAMRGPMQVSGHVRKGQQPQLQGDLSGARGQALARPQRAKAHARQQQQQQRALLGQLLQLQFLKASEQLVQSVWGVKVPQPTGREAESSATARAAASMPSDPAAAYATQVLLDPTGELLGPPQAGLQQQQTGKEETTEAAMQPRLQPHRLVARGLQVQFDGLLKKAFMAAAAAAAGSQQAQDSDDGAGRGGSLSAPGGREPWWLPRTQPVAGLLQVPADGLAPAGGDDSVNNGWDPGCGAASSSSSSGVGVRGVDAAPEGEGGSEPVLVLPVMSRALDVQFARLMREVLHSSLAAGNGTQGGA